MSADIRASMKSQQLASRLLQNQQQQQQNFLEQQGGQQLMSQHQQAAQLAALSNPMIVNSQPYNPSQQSQQQRCIGLDQQQPTMTTISRQVANSFSTGSSGQQQNSLYGSSFGQPLNHHTGATIQSHLFDSANHLQQSIFDSTCDISSSGNNNNNKFAAEMSQQQQQQLQKDNSRRLHEENQQQQRPTNQSQDVSFYSPSSSTSLLYHIYDQINLPSEHQQQQQQQHFADQHQSAANKKSNTTTILNPANLFNQQNSTNNNNLLPLQLHQAGGQMSELHKTLGGAGCYSAAGGQFHTLAPQATTFGATLSHLQHQQQQQPAYLAAHQLPMSSQLMLDTVMRRSQQQRPLSSSGASSMSGRSGQPIAYGRQPRLPTLGAGNKSQSNLASVLQSSNTLNHLGMGPASLAHLPAGPKSASLGLFGSRWKQMNKGAKNLIYEYRTIIQCSIVLIILALALIKLALPSASTPQQQHQVFLSPSSSSSGNSNSALSSSNNPLYHPPYTKQLDQNAANFANNGAPASFDDEQLSSINRNSEPQEAHSSQDVLKSKLLLGSFVVVSQNYSHSAAHKHILAGGIAKLMDQVFLGTEVRKVYSRMEVTSIRPNQPRGISVNFTIILSDSIPYAAQQFGLALFESLVKTDERLANQESYIIDKASIRLNTVPDKDLKDLPGELIPGSMFHDIMGPPHHEPVAPPASRPLDIVPIETGPVDLSPPENQVVWSEWSQWSSCMDKNGNCDASRHHSRLRTCVSQHTGDKVEVELCEAKFGSNKAIEVENCASTCRQQDAHIMSDAPSMIGPQTAPSVVVGGELAFGPAPDSSNRPKNLALTTGSSGSAKEQPTVDRTGAIIGLYAPPPPPSSSVASSGGELPASTSANLFSAASSTTERYQLAAASPANDILSSSVATPTIVPQIDLSSATGSSSQMSCSNCTSDEICLLLMQQKVPFCAKVKDRSDESGCGGWCKAQSQLCQPVGQNAFKCIHDSECLAEEWRCHDSACIPLSKRCDGHSNCYDSSDERDCPALN